MKIFHVLLVLLLGSGIARAADDTRCTVSFSSLRHDVCSGKIVPVSPAIASLANPAAFSHSRLRLIKFAGPITPNSASASNDWAQRFSVTRPITPTSFAWIAAATLRHGRFRA